jgi:hypothetical protein
MNGAASSPDFAELAARTGFSEPALRVLWEALLRGQGRQAQFDHPELGGMGQWLRGGMTMIGDMFNTALAAKVAGACALLAESAAAMAAPAAPATRWWPAGLGTPDSSAGQDELAYALFRAAGRVAVRSPGRVALYDVSGVQVLGIGMQSGRIVVQTAAGPRPLSSFPPVEAAAAD